METNAKIVAEPGKVYAGLVSKARVIVTLGDEVYFLRTIKRATLQIMWLN